MVGNRVRMFPDIARQVISCGSEIGNHTWDHKDFANLSEEQIKDNIDKTNDAIESITAVRPRLFRPAYGKINAKIKSACASLGMPITTWSLDSNDYRYKATEDIYNAIMDKVTASSIILCHDLHVSTGNAMKKVIPALVERGFALVTVSELIQVYGLKLFPGQVYNYLFTLPEHKNLLFNFLRNNLPTKLPVV